MNRWVSSALPPIFSLFIAPSGKLCLRVQRLLVGDELVQRRNPPLLKRRRSGPKHPTMVFLLNAGPTALQRVVEQKEPLRTVAAAYAVSHETIRRIIRHILCAA